MQPSKGVSSTLLLGLRALEVLATKREMGTLEVASVLGLPRATAHRLVRSLLKGGFVTQNPLTRKYHLAFKLWTLGSMAVRGLNFMEMARPFMEELARECGEVVYLGVLDKRADCPVVVHLDRVQGANKVQVVSQVGDTSPPHAVATGKALLAYQEPEFLSNFLAQGLRVYTRNTLVDPQRFQSEMEKIRRQGYATNLEEWRYDIGAVAAPLFDHSGAVRAALGIVAPFTRFDGRRRQKLAESVKEAAARISATLGYSRGDGIQPRRFKRPRKGMAQEAIL